MGTVLALNIRHATALVHVAHRKALYDVGADNRDAVKRGVHCATGGDEVVDDHHLGIFGKGPVAAREGGRGRKSGVTAAHVRVWRGIVLAQRDKREAELHGKRRANEAASRFNR